MAALLGLVSIQALDVTAQSSQPWAPQQVIPGYADDTWPPVLVADQNRTVHAFASQQVDDEGDVGIVYNQWTRKDGWTLPNDILLSPLKNSALVLDVLLDDEGTMHLIYFGGDGTEANIYYSQAPAVEAGRAPAWSEAQVVGENAASPPAAALTIDDQGSLVLLYNGALEGGGLYAVFSADGGISWSEPETLSVTATSTEDLWPYDIGLSLDESGAVHAIWNVLNIAGQGQGIFYAKLEAGSQKWSDLIELSRDDQLLELGTMTPAIIVHGERVVALYNVHGKIVMRESADAGDTWSNAVEIFPRHSGVNGTLALVLDGANTLHAFFGQRITGNPDIHGMWHSTLQDGRWLEPDAVVSGPQVVDRRGNRAFDPYAARAVASQGNVLFVAWRSDPGLRGNGVWFSHRTLDLAEHQVVPLLAPTATPLPAPRLAAAAAADNTESAPVLAVTSIESSSVQVMRRDSPASLLVLGLGPTFLLIAALLVVRRVVGREHR